MAISHALYNRIFDQLSACIFADEVFCSLTREMQYLPEFSHESALKTIQRENYETSYHVNTAAGNLQRLMMGAKTQEQEKVLMLITVQCLVEAKKHQKASVTALGGISASGEHQAWLEAAQHWQRMRRHWLKAAVATLRASIPAQWWSQGEALAE